MPRCIIFCALPAEETPAVRPGDFVIACDRGAVWALECGVVPDLLLGDFDSWEGELPGVERRRFPVEKDDTDSMLAVREGLSRGFREFVLYGALGGRLDHTLANVQTLLFLAAHGAAGALTGAHDTVTLVQNGARTFPKREGRSLSVLAFGGTARGVTLRGVQYPLQDAVLEESFPLGHGNRITGESAEVSVKDGTLLVVESRLEEETI